MSDEVIAPLSFRTYCFFFLGLSSIGLSLVTFAPYSSWLIGLGFFFLILGVIELFNWLSPLFSENTSRVIHWTHAMIFEFLIVSACFICLRPLAHLFWKKGGQKEGTPILFLHGYLHNRSAWIYLRQKLKNKGPLYFLNFTHPFQSIEEYAQKVASIADKIEKETQKKELVLIGHSMGGLVASWYALKMAPENKVSNLIAIGSPLLGTYLANFAPGPNARQMQRNSLFIEELQNLIQKNESILFYQIGTKTDQIVIPSSSSFSGKDKDKQFCLEDLGHLSLLFSPRVAQKIALWLK